MSRIEPYIQLRYWGLRASPLLDDAIADASTRLRPFRAQIANCQLHVGRWQLHHGQGAVFRATLTIDPEGGGAAISLEEEAELGAEPGVQDETLRAVFARAASRLANG